MLKIGLIGCGGISHAHVPGWKKLPDCELIAVCDVRPEMMDIYPDLHRYQNFDKMLENEDLDILDICLPTYLHVEYSLRAMEKGINVLCEKPISLHREDVEKLYACAEKNNVKFMTAHVLRFWPEFEKLKEFFDNKTYGKLLCGRMERLGSMPKWSWNNWMRDEKLSGLVPFDLHIHDLDWMIYALGTPKDHIVHHVRRADQDHLSIIYEFDDFYISTEASWRCGDTPFHAAFCFNFEDATVEYNGSMTVYKNTGENLRVTADASASDVINLPNSDAYANEIEYFKNCVLENKPTNKIKADELITVLDIINTF